MYAYAKLLTEPKELWVAFGTGKHYRIIPAHKIGSAIGHEKCLSLPMFHAFTGCDTVSCFAGRGKITAWEAMNVYPEVVREFAKLTNEPDQLDTAMHVIERYVVLLYDRTSPRLKVNEARLDLFARKGRDITNIPPTQSALLFHTKRAVYQAGYCWGSSEAMITLPKPEGWGWKEGIQGKWEPVWTDLPEATKACRELLRCGCVKGCRSSCTCTKAALACTALCKCGGSCQ